MKKILVPIDGSACSGRVIEQAKELAKLGGSKIILLYVNDYAKYSTEFAVEDALVPTEIPGMRDLKEYFSKQGARILNEGKALCADLGDQVATIEVFGSPAYEIVKYADENDIDLVVMGSHGMGGFKRFFMGSVTHKVALAIEKPILIIP